MCEGGLTVHYTWSLTVLLHPAPVVALTPAPPHPLYAVVTTSCTTSAVPCTAVLLRTLLFPSQLAGQSWLLPPASPPPPHLSSLVLYFPLYRYLGTDTDNRHLLPLVFFGPPFLPRHIHTSCHAFAVVTTSCTTSAVPCTAVALRTPLPLVWLMRWSSSSTGTGRRRQALASSASCAGKGGHNNSSAALLPTQQAWQRLGP